MAPPARTAALVAAATHADAAADPEDLIGPGRVELCYYCFDVLSERLGLVKARLPLPITHDPYPLFVTWDIERGGRQQLRGCIGNFSAMPLREGLAEYAITSAMRDHRFSPVVASEVPRLSCHVSLLTQFEEGADYLDWTIGTHGIWIDFEDDSGRRKTATYLPSVALEQGWTKVEAIDSLLRKGGYRGTITEAKRRDIRLTRYQAVVSEATYKQYERFRAAWTGSK